MPAYHHGDLRHALIEATEAVLAESGPERFSLREVARRAGVSPAAPAHHFGDAGGLLTTVAILAFDAFAAALEKAQARAGADPRERLVAQGVAYVEFALRHPGRFRLMFSARLDESVPDLARSGNAAFLVLENGIRLATGTAPGRPLDAAAWTALLALWSTAHGYASLAIAGRFDAMPPGGARRRIVAKTLRPVIASVVAGTLSTPERK